MGLFIVCLLVIAGAFGTLWYLSKRDAATTPGGDQLEWYCMKCGGPLVIRDFEGKKYMACPRDSFVHWDNPKMAVAVLVPTTDGRVVMVKRKMAPKAGHWALPGGFVERFELPDDAVVREVREETGIDVLVDCMVTLFAPQGVNEVIFLYITRMVPADVKLVPGSDALAVELFGFDKLPPDIAFSSHKRLIERYVRDFWPENPSYPRANDAGITGRNGSPSEPPSVVSDGEAASDKTTNVPTTTGDQDKA